jgi:two-component system, NtrC family, sensor histidine kinase HydH
VIGDPLKLPTKPYMSSTAPHLITARPASFRLLRWFGLISAAIIGLSAVALAWVMSNFLTDQMLRREASLAQEFVQNVLVSDGSVRYLQDPSRVEGMDAFNNSIAHLTHLRDVMRANVYVSDRSMLWSTDAALIGRRFDDNHELDDSLGGELVVEAGRITPEMRAKREHEGLSASAAFFVETYIPIRPDPKGPVVGVVELYKAPLALTEAIHEAQWRVAIVTGIGAMVLYAGLFGLVFRADRTMRSQQARLQEAETMAVIGEMASSVAHNIRNPLASIRSSAELNLDSPDPLSAEGARDILKDVDRISTRVTELLHLARQGPTEQDRMDLITIISACVSEQQDAFARRQQGLESLTPMATAPARGDAEVLKQVLHSVLSNASEAMSEGRACQVALEETAQGWRLSVRDQGPGMGPDTLAQVFRPFFTTKPKGLGLGLPLARRLIQRMGGRLEVRSAPGQGTTVHIELPRA